MAKKDYSGGANEPKVGLDDDTVLEEGTTATPVVAELHKPTNEELELSKQLEGSPKQFDEASVELLKHLCQLGIAADFGAEGYGRGFKWHSVNG